MYISMQWIKQYVDINPEDWVKIANEFTNKVAEIEEIIFQKKMYDNIVSAKITSCEKHPNADKLFICKCFDNKKTYTIITGAANVYANAIVPLAKIGAVIPVNEKKITAAEFKGIASEGMLCSSYELKLGEDHLGIMILPENTPIGHSIADLYDLNDIIIVIDNKTLTNRPDLWGHYGIAREFAAITKKPLKPYNEKEITISKIDLIRIELESTKDTPAYAAVQIEGISQKESPEWLKKKLLSVNQRPISFIVDLTNYIMLDCGEPCHAFDIKKIKKPHIKVRRSQNEKVVTLDGIERSTSNDNLLICDHHNNPIALAGLMGLVNSEIDENSTSILLELANFDQVVIRKSSNALDLRTEASSRFEKSLDSNLIDMAMQKFCQLLTSIDKNAIIQGYYREGSKPSQLPSVTLSTEFINRRLGTSIPDTDIIDILQSLQFKVLNNEGILDIQIPSFRATKDISIKEDIVEEIGRIYGYDSITPQSPEIDLLVPYFSYNSSFERKIRQFLVSIGYNEVLNYAFSKSEINHMFEQHEPFITLKNPVDSEKQILTKTLLASICKNVSDNLRFFKEFKLFEMEHVFLTDKTGKPDERPELCGAVVLENRLDSVYEARDTLVKLCRFNHCGKISIKSTNEYSFLHPFRSGEIWSDAAKIGVFGEVSAEVLHYFDCKKPFSIFQSYFHILYEKSNNMNFFKKVSKFPVSTFDLAFVVPKKAYSGSIIEFIKSMDEKIIDVILFDIYNNESLGDNVKSIAFTISIGSNKETLTSKKMHEVLQKIVKNCEVKGYTLRQ